MDPVVMYVLQISRWYNISEFRNRWLEKELQRKRHPDMSTINKTLKIQTSPHLIKGTRVDKIMRNVVYALIPTTAFAVYNFGLGALFVIATATFSAVITEHFLCKFTGKESTIGDWSAAITGLLFGLTLPPALPLWMVFCGGVISIALGKFIFGGLGYNVFNPALVGRAVLQAAFPVAITTWYPPLSVDRFSHIPSTIFTFPFAEPVKTIATGATPLSAMKFDHVLANSFDLFFGLTHGSSGETSALFILLGAIYLVARNMMNWRIPVSILASVYVISEILYLINDTIYPTPEFMLLSGGLMIGACFMASDMVASPITTLGIMVYGFIIALLIVVIRIWGGLPEGVMYAILFGNALSPHIDNLIRPRVYGTGKKWSRS